MALSLMKGGTYLIPDKTVIKDKKPVYHYTPGSYNAQKGKMLLQISSLDFSSVEFHSIMYPEENQTLEYAIKLSPNMSVPVLEIDDNVVINDSYDIHKYLMENYPGRGNASLSEDQKTLQEEFIQTNLKWDEYLFSYRRIPKFLGSAMHQIRLVELSKAIRQASTEGLLDKKLMDGRTVRQAYIDKVAQTRSLISIGCDNNSLKQLQKRIEANTECMNAILKSADKLLESHTLLLTDEDDKVTSADVYFAVFLNRITFVDSDGKLLKQIFADHPMVEKWWIYFNTLKESNALKSGSSFSSKLMMLIRKGPKFCLHGLGILKPSPLPKDIEDEVCKGLNNIMTNYCKT